MIDNSVNLIYWKFNFENTEELLYKFLNTLLGIGTMVASKREYTSIFTPNNFYIIEEKKLVVLGYLEFGYRFSPKLNKKGFMFQIALNPVTLPSYTEILLSVGLGYAF